MIPAYDISKVDLPETALALVCDERAQGEQLLEAIDQPGQPIFDAKALLGGWEIAPARTVIFWIRDPEIARLRRRIRLCRDRSRVIVIVESDQPDAIALALREGAIVLTAPGSEVLLASELAACLETKDESVLIDADELAAELDRALSRKLHRPSPQVRLSDQARRDALVERIANLILAEARGVAAAAPITHLDWETANTAVQTKEESGRFRKRAAEGAPDHEPIFVDDWSEVPAEPVASDTSNDQDLQETAPYSPPELELIEDVEAAAKERSVPPPLPNMARAKTRRVPAWAAITAVIIVASAGATVGCLLWTMDSGARAETPAPTLQLGSPSVVPVIDAAEPEPASVADLLVEQSPEASVDEPEPQPASFPEREQRAHRAFIRARAHHRVGRVDRALRSARFAVRLAPQNGAYIALLDELLAEGGADAEVTPSEESEILSE